MADISDIGNVYNSFGDLPPTAEERQNGIFSNMDDLIRYLDGGGLLYQDGAGNFTPNPILHIVQDHDEIWDEDLYYIYIDTDTQGAY